ncbi:MAG: SPOR domain-containing protein [Bacteroidales bacterium]|nr:SPOR domain-containing protein [Bacteroidales bacterium]
MKKILVFVLFIFLSNAVFAQDVIEKTEQRDTVAVKPPMIDSLLYGQNIFLILSDDNNGGKVVIRQDTSISSAMAAYKNDSECKNITGYRVRIFFDNKQNARTQSEIIENEFTSLFPNIRAYRNHVRPYFKVTVGDFRTKAEAVKFMNNIKYKYPSSFLVKETINYPLL